jgi:hypothetical protein
MSLQEQFWEHMGSAEMIRRIELKAILTVVLLAGFLGLLVLHAHQWRLPFSWSNWAALDVKHTAPTPEDSILAMLDMARRGNVKAYLNCFDGPLREQLAETIKESTEAQFRSYLMNQNAAFRGVAVSLTEKPDPDEARVRVEYVYSDRNEVQDMYLKQQGKSWKIIKVMGAERIKTLIPYGTEVTD